MLSHYYMVKFMGELRTKDLRQEKKYLLHHCKLSEFERKINLIGFRVNHESNLINNIYFEDNLMTSASEGIEGDTNRCKYRMRWYNNASEFTIENKIKFSSSGKKIKSVLKAKSLTEAVEEAVENADGVDWNVEEASTFIETVAASSKNLISGITPIGSCYEPGKYVRVTVGIKPETIAAAVNASATFNKPAAGYSTKTNESSSPSNSSYGEGASSLGSGPQPFNTAPGYSGIDPDF